MQRSIKLGRVSAYSALIALLIMSMGTIGRGEATSASLFLEPSSQTVSAIGALFTVNVSIIDVTNLYGYQLEVFYNSTLMNGTQVTQGTFLNESGGNQPFFAVESFTDDYNSTYGIVFVACTLTGSVSGVNGGGVLITVQFKSLSQGNSVPMYLADIELSDSNHSPIPYEILSGGTVTIIPEFTLLTAVLTFVTASIFVILVEKRAMRSRMRIRSACQ
jgi:hypothetical protein